MATETKEELNSLEIYKQLLPKELAVYDKTISFHDPDFATKLIKIYTEDGVAVICDVFSETECNNWLNDMVTYIESLKTGVDRNKIAKTWTTEALPPQTRPGLFQALLSNMPTVWEVRGDPRVKLLFTLLYSALRNKKVDEFIVSGDAVNIRPPNLDSTSEEKELPTEDWAHLDQTTREDPFQCIQGQAVLSNTTACFRASPKSLKVFDVLLDLNNIAKSNKGNWCKFPQNLYPAAQEIVKSQNGEWQIPVRAPKGSFIVWSSSTVHSAMLPLHRLKPRLEDPFNGWRAVIYVCLHPKDEVSDKDIEQRKMAYFENRTTNHWISKIFPLVRGRKVFEPTMQTYIDQPSLVYNAVGGLPKLTRVQAALIGLDI